MYGLYRFGDGTGVYRPEHKKTALETTIVNNTVKLLKSRYTGIIVLKIHGSGYQRAGIPDLYIGYQGVSLWVEMKRPGADTSKLQQEMLKKMHKTGLHCGIAESPQRVIEMLEEALTL